MNIERKSSQLRRRDPFFPFFLIDSQKIGGFRFDLGDSHAFSEYMSVNGYSEEEARKLWPAGGGGMTFRNNKSPTERYVYNYGGGGWFTDAYNIPKQIQRMGYNRFVTTVHEMFHAAGKTNNFGHEQMDDAAKSLGAGGFTDFVQKACIPQKYW